MGAVANSTRVRSTLSQKSCASYEKLPTRMTALPTPLSEVSDSLDSLGQNSSASHEIPPAQMSTVPWPLSEKHCDSPETHPVLCTSPSPSKCADLRDPRFQNFEKNSVCVPSEERSDLCDASLRNCDGDVVRNPSEERTNLCDRSLLNCVGGVVRLPSLPAGERADLRETVLHSSEHDVVCLTQTAPTRPPLTHEAAACYTQSIYRMKRERSKYLKFKSATISLQCAYRCNAARTILAGMKKASKYINTLQEGNHRMKKEMGSLTAMLEAQSQVLHIKNEVMELLRKEGGQQIAGIQTKLQKENIQLKSEMIHLKTMIEAQLQTINEKALNIEDVRKKDEETLALRSQLLCMEAELKIEKMSRADKEDMRRKDKETLALRSQLLSMEAELKIEKMSRADIEDTRRKDDETLALRNLKTVAEAQIPTLNKKSFETKKNISKRNDEVQAIRKLASLEAEVRIEKMSRDDAIVDDFHCIQETKSEQNTEIFSKSSIDASFRRIDASYHHKRKFALEHIESLLVAATSDSGDLEFTPQTAENFRNSMEPIQNTSNDKKGGITGSLQMYARSLFVESFPEPSSFDWGIKDDTEYEKDKSSAADWTRDQIHAFQNMRLECKTMTDDTLSDPWLERMKQMRGMCTATAEFTEFRSVVADTLSNIAATVTATRGSEPKAPPAETEEDPPVAKLGDSFFVMRKRSDGQMYLGLNSTTPQNPASS
eukprot:CAMPEP_0194278072 /NCGR_PEP_ID=MMETSP0169-20130528/10213_1 /TAXON_ID=218684 /ORGANISM="Corethron pennatum, Strain L29A3" /LENGTH=714 /DNA_ID=CAMNT_0039022183 /DNA_START=443 /DNA_END=2587 /DNA_ORIENTATION=+